MPVEFLEKLAVLIPKPRINLVVYHGVLAPPTSALAPTLASAASNAPVAPVATPPSSRPSRRYLAWAELLRRIFEIDILACDCGGRLRFLATIEDPPVVQRILRRLGLPTATPEPAPARAPFGADDLQFTFPS